MKTVILEIKYVDAIYTRSYDHNQDYVKLMTEEACVDINLEKFIEKNLSGYDEFYELPRAVECCAWRTRNMKEEKVKKVMANVPKKYKGKYINYRKAAVMCQLLNISANNYRRLYKSFERGEIIAPKFEDGYLGTTDEIEIKVRLYANAKNKKSRLDFSRANDIEKIFNDYLNLFDDKIKLLAEVLD